jgi:hypothetical protein
MVGASLLVLDVQAKLLQVHGPLLMAIILYISMSLNEMERPMISVDDYFLPQVVILLLSTCFQNGVNLFVLGGVFANNIR